MHPICTPNVPKASYMHPKRTIYEPLMHPKVTSNAPYVHLKCTL